MSSHLRAAYDDLGKRDCRLRAGAASQTLLVDIYLKEGARGDDLQLFLREMTPARGGVIEAEIYKDQLPSLRDLPEVSYIDAPRRQFLEGGSILSEAVNCSGDVMGICPLREQSIGGEGVTVAVLDSQFYRDALTDRELPQSVTLISDASYSPRERHGTACAELIHDVAPNATIYLVDTGESELDFISAVDDLMKLDRKPDVISCSLNFRTGLFNGKDEVCNAIRNATSRGAVWVNAAGNFADKHWSGSYKDPDGDGFNDFGPDDETINLTAERGEVIQVWLSWDEEWLHAKQDYDLYIYAPDGSYAASDDPQQGYFGQKPSESATMVAPSDGIYQLAIKRYRAAANETSFQLFSSHELEEYDVPNSSLGVMACCEDAITVGAVDITSLEIEASSSRGPTKDGRLKPDLVAPDNVTTISYWPEKFTGTSASAPYVAGCIALIMERFGRADSRKVKEALAKNARDLGAPGQDNAHGCGLMDIIALREL